MLFLERKQTYHYYKVTVEIVKVKSRKCKSFFFPILQGQCHSSGKDSKAKEGDHDHELTKIDDGRLAKLDTSLAESDS